MKGTEKQIAWATDIISAPADTIREYAEHLAKFDVRSAQAESASLLKAADAYLEMVQSYPNMDDAAFVIAKRARFSDIAKEVVRRTLIADGLHPSNVLHGLKF